MSLIQFLRIVWAYRTLILLTTLVCLATATTFVQLVKPRYEAQSRVMLDVIKPDPVTGQVMSTAFLKAYTKTQIELVKDQQVARRVVDDLGWAKNPAMRREYEQRPEGRDLDFPRWATERVVAGADATLITGSNILEISFGSPSPVEAKTVADALRKAYIEMTLQSRREAARRNAVWYEEQAQKIRGIMFKAEADKAALERSSGIVLQQDQIDIDGARLAALAAQSGGPVMAAPQVNSPSAVQLAQLDAELGEASKTLGPNHPQLLAMRNRRTVLAQQVAQERNTAGSMAAAQASAARATASMLEQQKAKVLAQRETVERLRLMQGEIDLRRDQYGKTLIRAAQLRQEAEVLDAGVVPLAAAITPQAPVFPQKALTIGLSIPLGAGLGIVIGLLLELIGRRVRSAQDLEAVLHAPVLAVLQNPQRKRRRWGSLRGMLLPKRVFVRAARA